MRYAHRAPGTPLFLILPGVACANYLHQSSQGGRVSEIGMIKPRSNSPPSSLEINVKAAVMEADPVKRDAQQPSILRTGLKKRGEAHHIHLGVPRVATDYNKSWN